MKIGKFLLFFTVLLVSIISISANSFAAEKKVQKKESSQYIVINKAVNKLAFYEDGILVNIFNVATGASAKNTPEGDFDVSTKWKCPIYYKTHKGGCEEGNPLGKRWIGLSVPGTSGYTYGIHGNNAEWSIGTYASAGCVRMHNWQVEQLFGIVDIGAKVTITRSNDSFDEIASSKGYKVKKSKKVSEKAYLFNKTDALYGLNNALVTDNVLEVGSYVISEQNNGWSKVAKSKNDTSYWIQDSNLITGDFKIEKDSYALLGKDVDLFAENSENSKKTNSTVNHIVSKKITTNDWSLISLNKQDIWVKNNTISTKTKDDYIEERTNNSLLLQSLILSSKNKSKG